MLRQGSLFPFRVLWSWKSFLVAWWESSLCKQNNTASLTETHVVFIHQRGSASSIWSALWVPEAHFRALTPMWPNKAVFKVSWETFCIWFVLRRCWSLIVNRHMKAKEQEKTQTARTSRGSKTDRKKGLPKVINPNMSETDTVLPT